MKQIENQIFDLLLQAPVPLSIYKGEKYIIEFANATALQIAGKTSDVIGKPLLDVIPEVASQGYIQLLDQVRQTGIPYKANEAPVTLLINGREELFYINFTYQPIREEKTGQVERIVAIANDVTEQVKARKKIEESEQRLHNILEQASSPIFILKGKELILEIANKPLFELWNVGSESLGMPLLQILPEIRDQGFFELLQNVYSTGRPYFGYEMPFYFHRNNNQKELHYFNFEYQPYREKDGTITGVLVLATDVTQQLIAKQKAEETEEHFRKLVMQAPIGMCILKGQDFLVEMVNDAYLEIVQRKRIAFEQKPLWECIPEVKSQGFDELLKNVLETGNGFTGREYEATLDRNGKMETIFVDFVYEPLRETGKPTNRILVLAIDVTDKVLARKKIEEAQENSKLAIEAAELGTYELDLLTNKVVSSVRLDQIFEIEGSDDRERYTSAIHPEDRHIRNRAYEVAYETGLLEYESRILLKDKSVHWIRVKGKILYNEANIPVRLLGVVQDITEQKQFSQELERMVDERTKELSQANQQLKKINRELEQFAYISSHDLQEPLRKIKMFSAMIIESDGQNLSESSQLRFQKVIDASDRMSKSLRDLLNYASTGKDQPLEKVDLNETLRMVKEDLELMIIQKKATVKVGRLPVIHAIPLQMQQLLYNLLNNALKFSHKTVSPIIEICSQKMEKPGVNEALKDFYEIKVMDNGVGFDPDGAEKIFGVFQRMHDKTSYGGTGIGLALCKKVVENHGGEIMAKSEPGKGSTFIVKLPVETEMT